MVDINDPSTWPHTTEDGVTKARDLENGGKCYFNREDESYIYTNNKDETIKQVFKDGTIVELFPAEGSERTTLPDGTVLTKTRNNTTVMERGEIKITKLPIGITIEENSVLKYKATRFPDGYEMIEQEGGLTIDRAPDGTMKVTYPNGMEIDHLEDGTKKVKTPEGRIKFIPPEDPTLPPPGMVDTT